MIGALRGRLLEKEPTRVLLDCAGIGFELCVPLSTSRRLGEVGDEVLLLVVMKVTRSGVDLFGFIDRQEREVFELLTSVRGVGPRAGLNLLSRFEPHEVLEVIASGRSEVLRTVPGIGPKKVDSIMMKLQGEASPPRSEQPIAADAETALVSLGLTRREARERLGRVVMRPGTTLQELLRLVLAQK